MRADEWMARELVAHRRPDRSRAAAVNDAHLVPSGERRRVHERAERLARLLGRPAAQVELGGRDEVRVIHGRGTGAIRAAVRDELARHPLVGSQESDSADGATIVHLGP